MALLYHCYEELADGGLFCPLTGQRLSPMSVTDRHGLFAYSDPDVSLTLSVVFSSPSAFPESRRALVDWNTAEHARIREDYGLWRRLTWFVLDALLAWSHPKVAGEASVTAVGAWLAGQWLGDAQCKSVLIGGGTDRDALIEEMTPFDLYPLRTAPSSWRFERGCSGAREGRIAIALESDRALMADQQAPLSQQLADVPRFIGSDGTVLFFHRVSPNMGPEYSPGMDYGFSDDAFAFYFSGSHASLLGKPIQLDPAADARQAMLWERGKSYLSPLGEPVSPRPRLHPRLRERLYFALGEAVAIRSIVTDFPRMAELEFGQEMLFGGELRNISQPPMSVGLPFCQLSFWPGHTWLQVPQHPGALKPASRAWLPRLFGRRL